jgi:hypothetical protein
MRAAGLGVVVQAGPGSKFKVGDHVSGAWGTFLALVIDRRILSEFLGQVCRNTQSLKTSTSRNWSRFTHYREPHFPWYLTFMLCRLPAGVEPLDYLSVLGSSGRSIPLPCEWVDRTLILFSIQA